MNEEEEMEFKEITRKIEDRLERPLDEEELEVIREMWEANIEFDFEGGIE
jgi:hypothetical protein